jgi:ferric-dicitrate binding protein FerR (iron transport regulator)
MDAFMSFQLEEAFQRLVDESPDHGTVYRDAIQPWKEIQNRFVRPRALRDYLVDPEHILRKKYVRQSLAAWRVEAGLMRTVATAAPRRSFDIANCDIKLEHSSRCNEVSICN